MKWFLVSVLGALLSISAANAQVSILTSRNNNNRDGQNLSETVLTPANVNVSQFGKLYSQAVDGYIYAQPLYVPNVNIAGGTHNVIYVATEHDSVYAFDADSNGAALWQTSFIDPGNGITTVSSNDVGCGDLVPEIGITGTPVVDPNSQTMYLVTKTKENGQYFQRLHAIDITTGQEKPNSPVTISAKVKGTGDGQSGGYVSFDPFREAQRPGLLLVNGYVFVAWASHCDIGPYHGWMMVYDQTSLKQLQVWNTTPNGGLGGIWQAGTGPASDGKYVFFATGNGTYDGPTGKNDYGDTVAKVPAQKAVPHKYDYFTPYNQGNFQHFDTDVGSGGVLLLPDQGQGAPHQHLLVQVGKSGSIYLIDRDHMGLYNFTTNQIVQDMEGAIGGLWSSPAWWNNNVYFGGAGDVLRQYSFDTQSGLLSNGAIHNSPGSFGYPGTNPVVSANGTSNGIVWALQTDQYGSNGPATLHAYDATSVNNELYNTNQNSSRDNPGGAVKFTVPTIANGRVYVPTSSQLSVYGLLGN